MSNILMTTEKNIDVSNENNLILHNKKQNISNKKIYFNADGTEIKIGYDDETGVGFVEIISD